MREGMENLDYEGLRRHLLEGTVTGLAEDVQTLQSFWMQRYFRRDTCLQPFQLNDPENRHQT